MIKIRIAGVLLSSLLLSACGYFNPKFNKPTVKLPYPVKNSSKKHDLSHYMWWQYFNDPKLNKLIEYALKNNDELKQARQNIFAAKENLSKTKLGWLPTLNAGVSAEHGRLTDLDFSNKSGNPLLNSIASENINSYSLSQPSVSLDYNLNILQQYQAQKLSKIDVNIEKEMHFAAKLSIINELSVAYFSMINTAKQTNIQEDIIKTTHQIYKDELIAFKNGSVGIGNVEQAKKNWLEAKIAKNDLIYNLKKYRNAIRNLTNHFIKHIKTSNQFPTKGVSVIENLRSQTLEKRPDVMLAEYKLKAANANIAMARSAFFPSINLTSAFGALSFELENLLTANSGIWSSSAHLTLPILNFQNYANAKEAAFNYKSAYFYYISTVKNAFIDTKNALNLYKKAQQTYYSRQSQLAVAKKLYTNDKLSYQLGELDYIPVLQQRVNYDSVNMSFIDSQAKRLEALSLVYNALAAGYKSQL